MGYKDGWADQYLSPIHGMVNPNDNEQFAQNVVRALTSREEAVSIGRNGHVLISELIDCALVARRLTDSLPGLAS